jgi:hypothetical protein
LLVLAVVVFDGKVTFAEIWPLVVLLVGASIACTLIARRKIGVIRAVRLGLLGEQAVAEQLHALLADGYRVFHDIPGDGKWNVDHVAVGPGGVFAIETKCRMKQRSNNNLREQDAALDGDVVRFPWCSDKKVVGQARANARWVAQMLSKSTGETVTARPIIALPGWFVLDNDTSDVKVLSGKQVSGFIASQPARLSPKLVQQIAYQLEQRCRDVEF